MSLLTVDGVIQEQTVCSPQGYFFIPMYDIVVDYLLNSLCRASILSLYQKRMVGV